MQEDVPCSDAVEEALQAPSMEVCMWQIATDKRYGRAIVALDQFLMDHSESLVTTVHSDPLCSNPNPNPKLSPNP